MSKFTQDEITPLSDMSGNTQVSQIIQTILHPITIPTEEIDTDYFCPITGHLFREPVVTDDGQTYEREAIYRWLITENKDTSPATGAHLNNKRLISNTIVIKFMDTLLKRNPKFKDSKEWYLPNSWFVELQTACRTGDEKAIKELASRDPRLLVLPSKNHHNQRALHFAANGHPKSLRLIIDLLEKRQKGLALEALFVPDQKAQLPIDHAIRLAQDPTILFELMTWMAERSEIIATKEFPKETYHLLQLTADEKYGWAQNMLGTFYRNGVGLVKNQKEAVQWFRKAADQGYPAAQNNMGMCYGQGMGLETDEKEAMQWFQKAADQGHPLGLVNMGYCYKYGKGGIQKDEKEAVQWYRKAAAQGNPEGQNALAYCYRHGIGLENDEKEAVRWYRKAAVQGISDAQFEMGVSYEEGLGVEKDEKKAVRWYRKAAINEHCHSQYYMAICYRDGIGVEKDEKEAVKWYQKAAVQGHVGSQYSMGHYYEIGIGVEKDEKEALRWYQKSADAGFDLGQEAVNRLQSRHSGVVESSIPVSQNMYTLTAPTSVITSATSSTSFELTPK